MPNYNFKGDVGKARAFEIAERNFYRELEKRFSILDTIDKDELYQMDEVFKLFMDVSDKFNGIREKYGIQR